MKEFSPFDEKLLDYIPQELKKLKQWVCWNLEYSEKGKPTKVPINPNTGYKVSVGATGKSKWTNFDTAVEAVEKFRLRGIGFVFTPSDPYCGMDLDDCRDKGTGEFGEWAVEIINRFDTYREISPSGTGLKMIIKGKLPGEGKKRSKFEVYDKERYFTMTGWQIPGEEPRKIETRQAQLDEFYAEYIAIAEPDNFVHQAVEADINVLRSISDVELLRLAVSAANGKKFKSLWDGNHLEGKSQSESDLALCTILAFWTGRDSTRMDKLFRQSGLFRKKWDERRGAKTYGQWTIERACASAQVVYDPHKEEIRNDNSNAEIFVELNFERFLYCSAWKTWLAWDGTYWSRHSGTEESAVYVETRCVAKHFLDLVANERDVEKQTSLFKWAVSCGERKRIESIIKLASARMDQKPNIFDRDPMLITCKNGTMDLRTGKLREHRNEDFITKSAAVSFRPEENCPVFDRFLEEIMLGDQQMVKYLWRVMGYALTGDIRERTFFVLHGVGKNGKTTLLETVLAILGNYGQKARFSSFLRNHQNTGPNDDIAHMAGARVVIASEAEQGSTLNTSLIKELTGGDMVRARFLYGKEFEYRPQAKIFFCTNSMPNIYETTHAIWDRIHYIPFQYRVPDDKLDKGLSIKIHEELDAIFSRAVIGCLNWQVHGLLPPEKVLRSISDLRDDSDPFAEWIYAKCDADFEDSELATPLAELHGSYRAWLEEARGRAARPLSPRAMMTYLNEHGFERKVGGKNVKYCRYIRLRTILA